MQPLQSQEVLHSGSTTVVNFLEQHLQNTHYRSSCAGRTRAFGITFHGPPSSACARCCFSRTSEGAVSNSRTFLTTAFVLKRPLRHWSSFALTMSALLFQEDHTEES